jgi:hypothetical protein
MVMYFVDQFENMKGTIYNNAGAIIPDREMRDQLLILSLIRAGSYLAIKLLAQPKEKRSLSRMSAKLEFLSFCKLSIFKQALWRRLASAHI